jgi:hypothetical protein
MRYWVRRSPIYDLLSKIIRSTPFGKQTNHTYFEKMALDKHIEREDQHKKSYNYRDL